MGQYLETGSKEVIKDEGGHTCEILIWQHEYPYKKRKRHQKCVCTMKKLGEDHEKLAICKEPRKVGSLETDCAVPLILDI